jgi:uncharacterized protein (TIGR02145 family)
MKKTFLLSLQIIFFILSCSNDNNTNPDTESPIVIIAYPLDNSSFVSGVTINIVAEAEDNDEVSFVQFYIDGVNSHEDSAEPYEYNWDTTSLNGDFTIYAIAIDNSENTAISDIVNVTVDNDGEMPYLPSDPNPQSGSNNTSIYTNLSWTCSDPNGDQLIYDVYFGTSSSPTLINSGQSETTYNLENLNESTTYFWKIVATDDQSNTTLGEVWQFTTSAGGTGTVTDIDGNVYQTIIIGNQEWMAENLRVTHYNDGLEIPNITDSLQWCNYNEGAYCAYNNDESNASTYGYLYNWYAAEMLNIAPAGWHVPTDEELMELELYMGMSEEEVISYGYRGTNEGSKLAGVTDLWINGVLVNNGEFGVSGFNIIPGGKRYNVGVFYLLGYCGHLWTTNELNNDRAWLRSIHTVYSKVYRGTISKNRGFNIRCVKD